ncbi:SDR family oxidoreductase [Ochrobactrum sp. CM-21-5]|nr:SDR family NAD(P)-dependent oxidoreductase [Ochrobactrum sp. CM-21-5]MBC2887119.1 SDR family oxidoreductase [Ochrobactrum sp. CM-21-5]
MSSNYWTNKVFVVTGGARGQGAAEVSRLLMAGAKVVVADVLGPHDADWSVTGEHADHLIAVTCDIAQQEAWSAIFDAVNHFDAPLFGLVNNAGITLRKTVTETSIEEWRRLLGINLDAAFLGIHHLAPKMADGASIVNISSTAGLTGYFSAAYTASKWGLRGLTKAAAVEFAGRGIRVNALCPGLVDTPMINKANGGFDTARATAFFDGNKAMTPLGRGATSEEIAGAVMFLLGPDSAFITGTDLAIDGGMIGAGIYTRIGRDVGLLEDADTKHE